MKKRSGEAVAAQHRPPAVMKHRLQPRGGAKNVQACHLDDLEDDLEEVIDPEDLDPSTSRFWGECQHEACSAPGVDSGDMRVYCDHCGEQI